MLTITFLGAAGTVTGSCFFLKNASEKQGLLIDGGFFQGPAEIEDLNHAHIPLAINEIAGILLTHAHLDHCGRLPLFVKLGYSGKFYMTSATRALAQLTLTDAVHVSREEFDQPLYDEAAVEKVFKQTQIVQYEESYMLGGYEVKYVDAGHILGAASILITDQYPNSKKQTVVFSGDLGNSPEPLVKPTTLIDRADVVVMESTYGDRTHSAEDINVALTKEIAAIEENNGTLLIPAFALEKTQELLHVIDHLKKEAKIKSSLQVFLDSPMATAATQIYRQYIELYNTELTDHKHRDDPFEFPGLTVSHTRQQSKRIRETKGPKIIIAGAGMLTGGRMLYHLIDYLSLETTRLLFVGFQAEGTLGRQLLEGATQVLVKDHSLLVRANIRKISSLSAHADQPKLLAWLAHIKEVKQVYLIHGEDGAREILKEEITKRLPHVSVMTPQLEQTVSL